MSEPRLSLVSPLAASAATGHAPNTHAYANKHRCHPRIAATLVQDMPTVWTAARAH